MLPLVRTAVQIFRSNVVSKNKQASHASSLPKSRRVQGIEQGTNGTQMEKFAMSALDDLLVGGALNINCILSHERVHLMWRLYRQIQSLMHFPHHDPRTEYGFMASIQSHVLPPMLPRTRLGTPALVHGTLPSIMHMHPQSPHQFMHHPHIAAQHQQAMESGSLESNRNSEPPAAPHQFLFRKEELGASAKHGPWASDSSKDGVTTSMPSAGILPLPRSGQKMKLNFHHQPFGQMQQTMRPPPLQQPMIAGHGGVPAAPSSELSPAQDGKSMSFVEGSLAPAPMMGGRLMGVGPPGVAPGPAIRVGD